MDCYLYVHICTGAPCVGTLHGEPWDLGPPPLSTSGHHDPCTAPGARPGAPNPGTVPKPPAQTEAQGPGVPVAAKTRPGQQAGPLSVSWAGADKPGGPQKSC